MCVLNTRPVSIFTTHCVYMNQIIPSKHAHGHWEPMGYKSVVGAYKESYIQNPGHHTIESNTYGCAGAYTERGVYSGQYNTLCAHGDVCTYAQCNKWLHSVYIPPSAVCPGHCPDRR